MPWFRLDDQAAFHAKLVAAGNAAVGAWARMGMWSSGQLTNGVVPEAIANVIASKEEIDRCLAVRLLERVDGTSFQVHDFLDYNPSRDDVLAEREAKRAGGRKGAQSRWGGDGSSYEGSHASATGGSMPPSRPVPTRPDPKKPTTETLPGLEPPPSAPATPGAGSADAEKGSKKLGRGSRMTEVWVPSPETVAWAHGEGVDVEAHLDEFRDYWIAVPGAKGLKADWNRTLRNRVRELVERERAIPYVPTAPPAPAESGTVPASPEYARAAAERIRRSLDEAERNMRPPMARDLPLMTADVRVAPGSRERIAAELAAMEAREGKA